MRGILRHTLQGLNDGVIIGILDRARSTGAEKVTQSIQAVLNKAAAPLAAVPLARRRCAATSRFSKPRPHSRIIRPRAAKACAVLRRAESNINSERSASLRTKTAIFRPAIAKFLPAAQIKSDTATRIYDDSNF